MTAKLIAEQGPTKGQELIMEGADEWIVGRDPDSCQFIIKDPKASRKHFILRQVREGIILENLSTTNPIKINHKTVNGPYLLQEGDSVKVGDGFFRFHAKSTSPLMAAVSSSASREGPPSSTMDPAQQAPSPVAGQPFNGELPHVDESAYYETIFEERDVVFGPPLKVEDALAGGDDHLDDLLPSARWLFKVMSGPAIGMEVPLEEGSSYTIGSDKAHNDIPIQDVSVSRQHSKITLSEEGTLSIEDLDSRNGTSIDGILIKEKSSFDSNHPISIGTTTFLVIDKEAKLSTLVTTLPTKQMTTAAKKGKHGKQHKDDGEGKGERAEEHHEAENVSALPFGLTIKKVSTLALVCVSLLFAFSGVYSLFHTEEITVQKVDQQEKIYEIIKNYPDIEFSYNTGNLFILGHVSTKTDKDRLLYKLNSLPYVTRINDNIIIDELVWKETNEILAKHPEWRGISLHSPRAGRFVITGYLRTKHQGEGLTEYINLNFPYVELLENKVVVEEHLVERISIILLTKAFHDIFTEITDGELTLSGYMPSNKTPILSSLISDFEKMKGIRLVRNFVVELAPEDAMINLSNRYRVTGHFRRANVDMSVVIDGRILARGDTLDGMTITSIKPTTIFLEKEGFKFRIDYTK